MSKQLAIIPGNGGGDVYNEGMWYKWVADKMKEAMPDLDIRLSNMPDPFIARESIWVPFMRNELGIRENSVIVGHSSGAAAAMRFCERYKVSGIVLVSAYTTDQGDENERMSEYFNRPWEWEKMKQNTDWIVQFGSQDDPFLPWREQVQVAEGLDAEFHQYKDKGHFIQSAIPEIIPVLKKKMISS